MVINPLDNVEIREDGHKYARRDIAAGENVIKYGMPIGHATCAIRAGEHVHTHNVRTNLGEVLEYRYEPDEEALAAWDGAFRGNAPTGEGDGRAFRRNAPTEENALTRSPCGCISAKCSASDGGCISAKCTFRAFRHPDGRVGVRNDIWVVPLVGCVNRLAERLAASCGGLALTHPYGCSQLGADHEMTANLLAALCRHPNAGGVLVVALGCENNTLESFAARLGYDPKTFDSETGRFRIVGDESGALGDRALPCESGALGELALPAGRGRSPSGPQTPNLNIRFLRAQDPGDEYARGLALIRELEAARPQERVEVPVSELIVGLKCGGSDGFSGLTANPLVGRFSDWLVRRGGATVLTEVPEMFGAETLLMKRCRTRAVFDKCVKMVNDFKDYYTAHHQVCYENPSPGNKAGGITTLEDKSLGCVQKGGSSPVEDVLGYGERVKAHGLSLLTGPGNDLVASTVLAAAGCHLILFTTGRGTPFGCVVPTMKIATNDTLAKNKPNWIDWNAMSRPDTEEFAEKVLAVASGEERAKNEMNGAQGIAIFKDGVTL